MRLPRVVLSFETSVAYSPWFDIRMARSEAGTSTWQWLGSVTIDTIHRFCLKVKVVCTEQ